MLDRLYDKLISYHRDDYYPFHMPGHKRNTGFLQMINPYAIDITEIEGFDNLHQAEGILKELSERISLLYGAGQSFLLVNGSTAGLLAGISATANRGDKVLIARNCHKAVHHGVLLRGLQPIYLYPPQIQGTTIYGGISSEEVEKEFLSNPDISLVVITSPTFDGIVSDISKIAEVVHRYGAYLLVDEAHGAHFGFHESFPKSAVCLGADIIIQSLHKTLPAFTQSAVLHSNVSKLNHKLEQYLSIYESSSPSYLLMAGIDRCISILEDMGGELFDQFDQRLKDFYHSMKDLKHIKLLDHNLSDKEEVYDVDPSKLIITVRGTQLTGPQLHTLLREKYHLIMEMEASDYVLGISGICDTEEGFCRLKKALRSIDDTLITGTMKEKEIPIFIPEQVMLPSKAAELPTKEISLKECAGQISASYVSMYPPGAPLLVPGERIDQELIQHITWLKEEGLTITGLMEATKDYIEVVCDSDR